MILGHHQLKGRVDELFPLIDPYKIGASSCDVTVGKDLILEGGEKINLAGLCEENPWIMEPGQFLLVSMAEWTKVPETLSCLFLLKSTQARMGMQHIFAGWIDPGWDGILTMELKNVNQFTPLALWPGMPIGQLIYMETSGGGSCYGGRYQHSNTVSGARKEIDYDAGA
tara:strand:+ start:28797 stop:29303 length:507 start_codon:yes stop_codon:yes gene_type:complete